MDRDYLLAHASAFEQNLVKAFRNRSPQQFYAIGEGIIELFFEEEKLGVKVLDDTHDHTDSYHVEAELDRVSKEQGIEIVFIQEYDGIDIAVEKIEKRLFKTSNK